MKRCTESSSDSTYCLDSCGGRYDDSQDTWADGFVYRYHTMGTWTSESTSDVCTNDMWMSTTTGLATDCSYTFPKTFYPFTPLCLRGCTMSGVNISLPSALTTLSIPACSTKTYVNGYTTSYTPSATSALSAPYTIADSCSCSDYPSTCSHYYLEYLSYSSSASPGFYPRISGLLAVALAMLYMK